MNFRALNVVYDRVAGLRLSQSQEALSVGVKGLFGRKFVQNLEVYKFV